MKTSNLAGYAALICGVLIMGCEPGEESVGIDSTAAALGDESVAEEVPVLGNDAPSRPVLLGWEDLVPGDTVAASVLSFRVANVSDRDYRVVARLLCSGLISENASLDLGQRDLAPGETAFFEMNAGDFPIQTRSGAAQARVELTLSRQTEAGTSERKMLSPVVYYRHGESYASLELFDEETLVAQHGGALAGVGAGLVEAGQVMGRVADGAGGFEEVKLMSAAHAVEKDGEVIGWETGTSIEIGSDEDAGEVVQ